MTTQLEDHGTHWTVATIQKQGNNRRMPRGRVKVAKGSAKKLKDEVIRQINAARARAGVATT